MEEIAAAKAMAWNVELDRGLRSSKPGAQWEAILKLGPRLLWWSQQPPVSAVTASLFKLDAGQETAFANAILMRLADAFQSGSNFTRLCILKVFLLEMRQLNTHDKHPNKGLLTEERVPNHVEILRRVKTVMVDRRDVTARALGLWMMGCLAKIAAHSLDVQHKVLEALRSSYQLELNAAMFAIRCLCKHSENFASVVLEMLISMINAMETTVETRLKAVRLLAAMDVSTTLALRAHEAGKILMLKYSTDEVVTTMLVALSRLAFKSCVTLTDQVDLLFSYMSSDPRAIVLAVSMKCLIKIGNKAALFAPFNDKGLLLLLSLIEDFGFPYGLQLLALEVMRKSCQC